MTQARAQLVAVEFDSISFQDWCPMWFDYVGSNREALPPEVHQLTFERIRNANTSLRGFVAAHSMPLGFVHYYFHPSSYNIAEACTIEDLYVSPEARGTGVGRWMIERVAQIATAAGAPGECQDFCV